MLLSGHNRLADYSATVVLACTHVGKGGVGTVTGVYICSEALDMKVSMVSAWTVLSGSSFRGLVGTNTVDTGFDIGVCKIACRAHVSCGVEVGGACS